MVDTPAVGGTKRPRMSVVNSLQGEGGGGHDSADTIVPAVQTVMDTLAR